MGEGWFDSNLLAVILDYCGEDLPTFDEEVRITYIHEFGHYLGLNESELESRGLG